MSEITISKFAVFYQNVCNENNVDWDVQSGQTEDQDALYGADESVKTYSKEAIYLQEMNLQRSNLERSRKVL